MTAGPEWTRSSRGDPLREAALHNHSFEGHRFGCLGPPGEPALELHARWKGIPLVLGLDPFHDALELQLGRQGDNGPHNGQGDLTLGQG